MQICLKVKGLKIMKLFKNQREFYLTIIFLPLMT